MGSALVKWGLFWALRVSVQKLSRKCIMGVMALFFAYYHEIGLDLITFLASIVCVWLAGFRKFGNDPSSRPEYYYSLFTTDNFTHIFA